MSARRPIAEPRFLVVREYGNTFYDVILEWTRKHHPDLSPLFRVRSLPCPFPRLEDVVVYHPWLQDPVQAWSMNAYLLADRLAQKCDARGIPVINRVDRLTNASKSNGARIIGETGLRTPRIVPIVDREEFNETLMGVGLPLFVRDDWGHQGVMLRADTLEEARRLDISRFTRPIAVELIDLPDDKGLYRKYRYVAAGDIGISHHVLFTTGWIARGKIRVLNDETRAIELAYCDAPDPNHDAFQKARRALGLDLLAIDYGYDREGRVIVWEANPFPFFHFSKGGLVFRNYVMDRTMAALVKMYLVYGGVAVPDGLEADIVRKNPAAA
jgi:hypothetical protein